MAFRDPDKPSSINELKTKLFSNSYKTRIEHYDTFLKRDKPEVPDSWQSKEKAKKPRMKASMFKKFFIFSIIFFGLALLYVGYNVFEGGNTVSNDNIDIAVLGNTFTGGGEDLPLIIEVTNRNNSALELADLVVEYPRGASALETERLRVSLGTIPSGTVVTENLNVILFGEQGSLHNVEISLEYRLEGSNAIFVKEKPYEVTINSTPINLLVEAPTEASPNQEITLSVKTTLNSQEQVDNMVLKVDYPVGFQFISATPSPDLSNNVWELGDLAPGKEDEIQIVGKLVDVFDGEEKTFKVWSGSQSEREKSEVGVVFNSLAHTLQVQRPFIEAKLFVNGDYSRGYSVNSKETISGEIRWVNNLDTKVNDLEIKAKLSGNALDRTSVITNDGFYNSPENTIVWDRNSQSAFKEVAPGRSGSVNFVVSPSALFSGGNILNAPEIKIDVAISGKQSIEGNLLKSIENSEQKVVRITSDVSFANKVVYYSGPFQNSGPMPPKSEQETTYTVVWTLTNTANAISDARIRSTLPPWVRFTGSVSPANENVTYNASTKEVIWNIGNIPRGAGISGEPREVAFQIAFTPSISQIGKTPTLINDAVLTGTDDFANVDVRINKASLNTRLPNDPLAASNSGRVEE